MSDHGAEVEAIVAMLKAAGMVEEYVNGTRHARHEAHDRR